MIELHAFDLQGYIVKNHVVNDKYIVSLIYIVLINYTQKKKMISNVGKPIYKLIVSKIKGVLISLN